MRYRRNNGLTSLIAMGVLAVAYMLVDLFRGLFAGLVAGIAFLSSNGFSAYKRATFRTRLKDLVLPHLSVLTEKRAKLLVRGDYGEWKTKKWSRELQHFMQAAIWPQLGSLDLAYANAHVAEVANEIDAIILEAMNASPNSTAVLPAADR